MRKFFHLNIVLLVFIACASACPDLSGKQSYAQSDKPFIKGLIKNYAGQPLYIYKCYGDTLLFIDSVKTDSKGNFAFSNPNSDIGLYRFNLPHNQWFYLLWDGKPVRIETVYQFSAFYNIATDSLVVIASEENKAFFEFQHLQSQLNIAGYWLLKMLRLYPQPDPFHQKIEDEYVKRFQAMKQYMEIQNSKSCPESSRRVKIQNYALKVADAYYTPVNPDWKQPDDWRDSIIASHYFDYFNPADSFYLQTNILPEKMDIYIQLKTNKHDAYGQPVQDEHLFSAAAIDFVKKTVANNETYRFCLNYFLKKFNEKHHEKESAFITLYDYFLKTPEGDCGSSENNEFTWARKRADILRNVQIGSAAPDFQLMAGKLNLYSLSSENTLVIFYASWCPHCTEEIPKIKQVTDSLLGKGLTIIAVSLDTSIAAWKEFVSKNQLLNWLHYSEWKGWQSDVAKLYNVYATPTMFLLDEDKKIIAKPITATELLNALK